MPNTVGLVRYLSSPKPYAIGVNGQRGILPEARINDSTANDGAIPSGSSALHNGFGR